MDNQHKKIKGYRDLSQAEIDLMNRIKAHAEETRALVDAVRDDNLANFSARGTDPNESGRWAAIASTHLQQGFMALTRAVAQPTTY